MSTKIRPALESLARQELEDANSKFEARFHSAHEGCSIIWEEVEEAEAALMQVKDCMDWLWNHTKGNRLNWSKNFAGRLRESALDLASEAIQTAAMAQKFLDSVTDP